MAKTRLQQWKDRLDKLTEKRERNIDRYILPIEIEQEQLRDKIMKANKE